MSRLECRISNKASGCLIELLRYVSVKSLRRVAEFSLNLGHRNQEKGSVFNLFSTSLMYTNASISLSSPLEFFFKHASKEVGLQGNNNIYALTC